MCQRNCLHLVIDLTNPMSRSHLVITLTKPNVFVSLPHYSHEPNVYVSPANTDLYVTKLLTST